MFRKSDKQIVRRVLAGSREDYGVLVERYGSVAQAVAYARTGNRSDAEDVTQDAFLTAFLRLDTLRDASSFAPWLLTIVRHAAGKLAVKRHREHEDLDTRPVPVVLPDLEEREMREQVRAQVMELEEPAREILLLYYFAAYNTRGIAKLLGLTPDAVEKRLQRARAQVGAALLRELGGEIDSRAAVADRRQRVMGVVGTMAVPWAPKAAAGIVGSLFAAAAAKPVLVGGAAVLIGAVAAGYAAIQPSFRGGEASFTISAPAGGMTAAPARPDAAKPVASSTASKVAVPPPSLPDAHGPGRIIGRTLDENDQPVANAEVTLVETDWGSYDPPASSTHPLAYRSDVYGRFDITGLPLRRYAVQARSGNLVAESGADLSEKEPESDLELVLLTAAHVAGRVVDGKGRPVARAWVVPVAWEGDGQVIPHSEDGKGAEFSAGMAKFLGVWTDTDGRFRIEDLHSGSWRLAARAEGFAWTRSSLNAANSDSVELKLDPESRIAGHVVDSSGQPVSKADVLMFGEDLLGPQVVYTADDGAFLFPNLGAGDYTLEVLHDTLASIEPYVKVALGTGNAKTDLALKMAVGSCIAGRVVDSDTALGVAGITVSAGVEREKNAGMRDKETTTDSGGRYRLAGLAPGECSVGAERAWGYESRGVTMTLAWSEVVEGIDFSLSHGTSISGRVYDAAGKPVPEAKVVAVRANQEQASCMSRLDGTFMLSGFRTDAPLRVYAAKKRMIAQSDELSAPREGLKGVTLKLEPGASFRARVLDPAGHRVPFADVQIVPEKGRYFLWGERSSSGFGIYNTQGLLPGAYTLSASSGHDSEERGKPVQITLEAGNPVEDLVLTASPATAKPDTPEYDVAVNVADELGQPVVGVQVWVTDASRSGSPRDATDKDGLVRVEDVPAGTYIVWADGEGFRSEPVEIEVPANTHVRLIGMRSARIEGRIVGPDGQPVRRFSVMAVRSGAAWRGIPLKTPDQAGALFSDSGSFSIIAEPDSTGVGVWATGFTPTLTELPGMAPGEKRAGLVIRLESETTVAGRVVASDGGPVVGASIFARALPQEESPQDELLPSTRERETLHVSTTDADGRFEARALPAVALRLWARDDRHLPASQVVTPIPGRTTKADFVLEVGGRVEGTVTLGGKPVPTRVNVTVYGPPPEPPKGGGLVIGSGHAQGPELAREEAMTDGQGRFATCLPAGLLVISTSVSLPDGRANRLLREERSIEAGQTVQVDLAFADDGAELSGTLTIDGVPAVSGGIGMSRPDGPDESISFWVKNGVFQCTGLPAGTWDVRASNAQAQPDDYHHSEQPLTVDLRPRTATRLDIALP